MCSCGRCRARARTSGTPGSSGGAARGCRTSRETLAKHGGEAPVPWAGCAAPALSPPPAPLSPGRPAPLSAGSPQCRARAALPPASARRPACARSGAAAAPHRAAIGQRLCPFYPPASHWLPAAVTAGPASSGGTPRSHWAARGAARRIVRGLAVRAVRLRSNQAAGHGAPVSTSVRGSGAGVPARAPRSPRSAASPPPLPPPGGTGGQGRAEPSRPRCRPPARLCEAAAAAAGSRRRHFGCGGQCRAASACRDSVATWGRPGGQRRRGNRAGAAGGGDGAGAAPGAGPGGAGGDTVTVPTGRGALGPAWQWPGSSGGRAARRCRVGAAPARASAPRARCSPSVETGFSWHMGSTAAVAGESSELTQRVC